MEGPHDPNAGPSDVILQAGGLQIFLEVHAGKAAARVAAQKGHPVLLGTNVFSAVPDPAHRQDDRKTGALRQPPDRLQLRCVQMVGPQFSQVDAAAQRFNGAKVGVDRFRGQDQADL